MLTGTELCRDLCNRSTIGEGQLFNNWDLNYMTKIEGILSKIIRAVVLINMMGTAPKLLIYREGKKIGRLAISEQIKGQSLYILNQLLRIL